LQNGQCAATTGDVAGIDKAAANESGNRKVGPIETAVPV
jgi:hypothetical protein